MLLGTCDEDLAVPYQPFVEALRHVIAACPEDQLVTRLGDRRNELARLVPELPHRVPGLSPPQPADPDTERYLLFEAVAGWLAPASPDRPVVLLLGDLHWATKPTMLMLKHIVRFRGPVALFVITTYRDSDLTRSHPPAAGPAGGGERGARRAGQGLPRPPPDGRPPRVSGGGSRPVRRGPADPRLLRQGQIRRSRQELCVDADALVLVPADGPVGRPGSGRPAVRDDAPARRRSGDQPGHVGRSRRSRPRSPRRHLGRYDEADGHFAAAVDFELRMGSRAMLVHSRLEWARAMLYRGNPGDDARGLELLTEALDGARELELTGTERRIKALLEEAGPGHGTGDR